MSQHVSDEILVLCLDNELDAADNRNVIRHLNCCEECRDRWQRVEELSDRVVEYHRQRLQPLAPEVRIPEFVPQPRSAVSRASLVATLAAAAAVIFAVWRIPVSSRPVVPATLEVESIAKQPEVARDPDKTPSKVPRAPKPLTVRRALAEPWREIFLTLPYSDPSLPLADALVLRVDLPREVLFEAGLPMAENRGERVLADVVMGLDGLPRGIRLVQ